MNRLEELRLKRGWNATEAAEKLGFPKTTYYNYEKGNRQLYPEQLIKIADFYGVSIDYLLGRDERIMRTPLDEKYEALEGHGIAFSAPITKTPCVYMGDLHNDRGLTPCFFSVREGEHQVYVLGNRTVHHMVFWANPQVACIEPYMPLELAKGQNLDWMLDYSFMP